MITGYQIEQVLPHEHPMILLNEFTEAGEDYAVCKVFINNESPFYDKSIQAVPTYVGIEYMAQAIAAYAGAHALQTGGEVKIGFLLGCRKYQPSIRAFTKDSALTINVQKIVVEDSGLSVFECQIFCLGQCLVKANLNVFQPDDPKAWLTE